MVPLQQNSKIRGIFYLKKGYYFIIKTSGLLIIMLLCSFVLQAQDSTIYDFAEEYPGFPGCEDKDETTTEKNLCSAKAMRSFLVEKAGYPKSARERCDQGTVYIRVIVEKDGSISKVELAKDMSESKALSEAALTAVRTMDDMEQKWIPGRNKRGENVRVRMTIPIKFTLNCKKLLGIF